MPNLPPQLAKWLSDTFKVEAYALRDLNLRDAEDAEIFEKARLDGIVIISKGTGALPISTPYPEMSLLKGAVGASVPTPIQIGEQEVSVTVNVIFGVE